MAGIYIHIPFCKQACSYCDFHFSTSQQNKQTVIECILKEIELRKNYLTEPIDTIYFGGGTPSILVTRELKLILDKINDQYTVKSAAEITLEGNPDDLSLDYLKSIKSIGVNRLSVGIQSFFENDLSFMNRAHNEKQAVDVVSNIKAAGFNNYTIDLIYGSPTQSKNQWKENLNFITHFDIPHFSAYSLTVEEKTVLAHQIKTGKVPPVKDERTAEDFKTLIEFADKNNYTHYEISNFCKKGFRAKHNYAYWEGKNYMGVGPSAHSYSANTRQWNVANNSAYILALKAGEIPYTIENLSNSETFNEMIMIKLRIAEGINKKDLNKFDSKYVNHFYLLIEKWISKGLITNKESNYFLSSKGKFFADQIASDLFYVD